MATFPYPDIDLVPAESAVQSDPYPSLDSITVFDVVGPTAANRQPRALRNRTNTLRERVNYLVENSDFLAQGGPGGGSTFFPRDG